MGIVKALVYFLALVTQNDLTIPLPMGKSLSAAVVHVEPYPVGSDLSAKSGNAMCLFNTRTHLQFVKNESSC